MPTIQFAISFSTNLQIFAHCSYNMSITQSLPSLVILLSFTHLFLFIYFCFLQTTPNPTSFFLLPTHTHTHASTHAHTHTPSISPLLSVDLYWALLWPILCLYCLHLLSVFPQCFFCYVSHFLSASLVKRKKKKVGPGNSFWCIYLELQAFILKFWSVEVKAPKPEV